jgi:hypothetical protein
MKAWKKWNNQIQNLRRDENRCQTLISQLKTRWIFRAWKLIVESEFDIGQEPQFSGKRILSLTIALRHREIEDHRQTNLAILQHQRTLFHGWRRTIINKKRILADQEAVLTSLITCQLINSAWREWRSILISRSHERKKLLKRFWRRWECDTRVRTVSRRMKKRAIDDAISRSLFFSMARWIHVKEKHSNLRNSLRRCQRYLNGRWKLRALLWWKHSFCKRVEEKRKSGHAMVLYLMNLQKRTWAAWVRCHRSERIMKQRKRELLWLEIDRQALQAREMSLSLNDFEEGTDTVTSRSSEELTFSDGCEDDCLIIPPSILQKKLKLALFRYACFSLLISE